MVSPYLTSIEDVLRSAKQHGLELDVKSARANISGMDFFAVFARDNEGTEWVLRSPRRAEVVERARHERRVLDLVRPRLPVAVPEWRIHSSELIAYPKLLGVPAGEIDLEAKAYAWNINHEELSSAFIQSTADALVAIHAVDYADATAADFDTPDISNVRKKISEQINQVRRKIGVADRLWQRWQTWLSTDEFWRHKPTFVHGDFHAGHMIIDEGERLTGILDWTEGEVGDPAIDFAAFQMVFGV